MRKRLLWLMTMKVQPSTLWMLILKMVKFIKMVVLELKIAQM